MAAQLGLLVVGGFSLLILFSFGGQLVVAPALLPAQWLIARHTLGTVSIAFSVLGALLVAEVTWLVMALVIGDGVFDILGVLLAVLAVAAGLVFFRSSRPVS